MSDLEAVRNEAITKTPNLASLLKFKDGWIRGAQAAAHAAAKVGQNLE
jgi:hypothetical protein